jgi:hypothetical protein
VCRSRGGSIIDIKKSISTEGKPHGAPKEPSRGLDCGLLWGDNETRSSEISRLDMAPTGDELRSPITPESRTPLALIGGSEVSITWNSTGRRTSHCFYQKYAMLRVVNGCLIGHVHRSKQYSIGDHAQ